MNYTHGYLHKTETWGDHVRISGPNVGTTPPEPWLVDPYLPILENDHDDPRRGVVIPAGRICGVGTSAQVNSSYRRTLTSSGRMPISLHDGKNLTPFGVATSKIYRRFDDYLADSYQPTISKEILAEFTYVTSVNDAYGTLSAGDRVTSYWGSTTSTSNINFLERGRPVKWFAKKTYMQNGSAGASHPLDATIYPGITPRIIAAMADDGSYIGATSALTFNGSSWTAGFTGTGSGTVENVWFEYGQDADQIVGEISSIRSLSELAQEDQIFKYVESGAWMDVPLALQKKAITSVALTDPTSDGETPTTVTAGREYRVQNYPMDIHSPVIVYIQGTVVDAEGTATEYTSSDWYRLPDGLVRDSRSTFYGTYHSINWSTGLIELASNLTVTAIKIGYSYITDSRDGIVKYGQGVYNLTDGNNLTGGAQVSGTTVVPTDPTGVQAHLNRADVKGAFRVFVY